MIFFFLKPRVLGAWRRTGQQICALWHCYASGDMILENMQKMLFSSFFEGPFFHNFIFRLGTLFSLIVLSSKTFSSSMDLHSLGSITPCDVLVCQITWFLTKMTQKTYEVVDFENKWNYMDSNENNTKYPFKP